MTPLANHISVFLRQRLPIERRASELTTARPNRSESGFPRAADGAILTH
jgi:hypothetical protein